jgi:uncharacterized OB-fold protein
VCNIDSRLEISPLVQYQNFLSEGKLAYQYSLHANKAVFYPRVVSPYGGYLEWRVSIGLGTVYAATWIPVKGGTPYSVVLVDMDEGFRLMSNVVGGSPEAVCIGDRVRFKIGESSAGESIPVFERISSLGQS